MANEVSTYTTNGSANIKEDVDDAIYSISPEDTVFMNLIKKGKADSTKVEWLEDADRAAGANAKPEEWDGTATQYTLPVPKYNYTQIFGESFKVTDTMENVKKHGRTSEIASNIKKALRLVAKDIEYALLNNATAATTHTAPTSGGTPQPGKLLGAKGFITTNTYNFSNTTTNACDLTEVLFVAGQQAVWNEGGDPTTVIAPPDVARVIAGFSGNAKIAINTEASKKTLGMKVDYYQSQFGLTKVILSRHLEPKDVSTVKYDYMLIVDPERWELAWLQKPTVEKLPKLGRVQPVMVSAEASLKCFNEASNYMMSNISRV